MTRGRDATSATAPPRAVIDIGSNTVRLVLYGGARRAPTVLLNESVAARLGGELQHTGKIGEGAMDTALAALRRFRRILTDLHVAEADVIATAAARLAENGPAFLDRVRECGFQPELLSGEAEARTSAMGVIGAFPGVHGVVVDLGGASLELVEVRDGQCANAVSLPLGTLLLPGLRSEGEAKFRRFVNRALKTQDWTHPVNQPLYMVGGTWRALAGFAMHEAGHPLTDPHGFEIGVEDARRLARRVRMARPGKLDVPRVSSMRAAMLPDAAALLHILIARLEPARLVFSAWGLREGRLFQRLDRAARARDPLLAGVADFAAPRGGSPTLATLIASWTVDALPHDGGGSERVRLAAAMLALASLQIEPNLRLKQAINWALYKRWLDLPDEGRAMIAAALAANCGSQDLPKTLGKLANRDRLDEAVGWGLAIRLARRLGAGSSRSLHSSALAVNNGKLRLYLGESHAHLRATHVEQDLATLAERLDLHPAIEIVPNDSLFTRGGASASLPAGMSESG